MTLKEAEIIKRYFETKQHASVCEDPDCQANHIRAAREMTALTKKAQAKARSKKKADSRS